MKTLSIALIGIGHGAEYQIAALALSKQWRIVGATDINTNRQSALPSGVPFFNSVEQLLKKVQADVFIVATPNEAHFETGILVLSAGQNLLLEKPCARSLDEFEGLVRAANKHRVFFNVALHAAFASDLQWFVANRENLHLGDPTAFFCGFFDPYITSGALVKAARSLGGSWFDSGINALSVIASVISHEHLRIVESRVTRLSIDGASDVQASVDVSFDVPGPRHGHGLIETNWTLGMNRKTTRFWFAHNEAEVLLDHSNERVVLSRGGIVERRIELGNGRPRLVNHYASLFEDTHRCLSLGRSNIDFAAPLHHLLFEAGSRSLQGGHENGPQSI